jgi:aspartate aminotransferase-like enzyme
VEDPLLLIPGPTPLPPEVLAALSRPMISHRSPAFRDAQRSVRERLRGLLQTAGEVVVLPGSGTGSIEAAIVNSFSPGDRVVAGVSGSFGDRLLNMSRAFGLQAEPVAGAWGRALQPADVAAAVTPDTRGVLLVYSETSTGALLDLQATAAAVRAKAPDTLILVDAVSALGGAPIAMDAWDIDLVSSGAQKALMSPPGLAIIGVGPRALANLERARLPKFFWDFRTYIERARAGGIAYTPSIPLIMALDAALRRAEAEGWESVYRRHAAVAAQCRAGLRALGFQPLAPEGEASPTVTAVTPPAPLTTPQVIEALMQRGIEVTTGIGKTADLFRVGHMGYVGEAEVARFLAALREATAQLRGVA